MTICSWRAQSAQMLVNSNDQHAKLHVSKPTMRCEERVIRSMHSGLALDVP
jgi:hypothetical protein